MTVSHKRPTLPEQYVFYCKTCDERTQVLSNLHFCVNQTHFNIEMYLRRGDTGHSSSVLPSQVMLQLYLMYFKYFWIRMKSYACRKSYLAFSLPRDCQMR